MSKKSKYRIVLFLIFVVYTFLRFYQFESRNPFTWDQVDNAWVAKDIIVDHRWPLVGMQAKQNSGFYIGPAYYYLMAIVYFFTNLDPIASGILAGLTSIITFWVIFYLTKKMFSFQLGLIVSFIQTFSVYIISLNRTQWPINFIAPISLVIFYALYQIILGKEKYIFLLSLALGFSFHLNFTAVFFPLMIFFALPFFPRNKRMLKYSFAAVPLFLIWLIPNFIANLRSENVHTNSLFFYLQTYYHGFHFVRVLQLAKDALIEFDGVLIEFIKPLKYLLLPIFLFAYYFGKPSRKRFVFCYLAILWFLVPWLAFSLYSGEITNYYFSLTRPISLIIAAFVTFKVFQFKNKIAKIVIITYWLYFVVINIQKFQKFDYHQGLAYHRMQVKEAIERGEKIKFQQGIPKSYLYYFYTRE